VSLLLALAKLCLFYWIGMKFIRASRMKDGQPRDGIANVYLLIGSLMIAWCGYVVLAGIWLAVAKH